MIKFIIPLITLILVIIIVVSICNNEYNEKFWGGQYPVPYAGQQLPCYKSTGIISDIDGQTIII